MNWLLFALLTVVSWGVYGVMLHQGQLGMADKDNGRYMAFLYVGIAYFLTAVLAPLLGNGVQEIGVALWAIGRSRNLDLDDQEGQGNREDRVGETVCAEQFELLGRL